MSKNHLRRQLLGGCLASFALPVLAQSQNTQRGGLYDPEPPADSAYLRVLVVGAKAPMDIMVDGKARGLKLVDGEASDYLVVAQGRRGVILTVAGKSVPLNTFAIDLPQGRAVTLAYDAGKLTEPPRVFEDRSNTNKLKAQLAAYNLDGRAQPLDVMTADGSTRVFNNLAFGGSNSIQVNPISVELNAARPGAEANRLLATPASLSMQQGGSYSVFFIPDGKGGLAARAVQNRTERYQGSR